MQVIRLKAGVYFLRVESIQCLQDVFFPNLYENGKSLGIEELLELSQMAFNLEELLRKLENSSTEDQSQLCSSDFSEFLKRKISVSF